MQVRPRLEDLQAGWRRPQQTIDREAAYSRACGRFVLK